MKKIMSALAFGVLCASTSMASGETLVFASGLPESSFLGKQLVTFKECVETTSKGELKLEFYPNGSLVKREGMLRALQSGQVKVAELNISAFGNEDEIFNLPPIPGLAKTPQEFKLLWEKEQQYLDKWFATRNVKILFPLTWPGQGIYTNTKLEAADDTTGKLYVYSPATQRLGELMGFNPVVLPFAEIPQAFSTGMINSMYTSAQTGVDIQAWDFVKFYSYAGGGSQAAVGINSKAFEQLGAEKKQAIEACGKKAHEAGFTITEESDAILLNTLKQKGMTVNDMPPPVRAKFDKAGEVMLDEWRKRATPEARAILEAYLAARKR